MTESLDLPPAEGEKSLENGIFSDLAVRTSIAPSEPAKGRSVPPPPPRSTYAPPRAPLPSPPRGGFTGRPSVAARVSPDVTVEVKVEAPETTTKAIPALNERVESPSASVRSIPPPPSTRPSAFDVKPGHARGAEFEPLTARASFDAASAEAIDMQEVAAPLSEASLALADLARLRPMSPNASAKRETSGTYVKAQAPAFASEQVLVNVPERVHAPEPQITDTSRQIAVDYTHVFQPASASVPAPSRQPPYAALSVIALIGLCFAWYVFDTRMVPGVVQVTTTPADAQVLFDGVPVGSASPFLKTGVTPSAMHSVEVKKTGYKPWVQEVELRPGQTLAFDVKLPPVEEAPLVGRAEVKPSTVAAQALPPNNEGSNVAAEPARVEREEPVRVEREEPARVADDTREGRGTRTKRVREPTAKGAATGTLRVSSRPWSVVFVDGKNMGNTPQTNLTLPAGTHQVRLKNPEFNVEKTVSVDIVAGETKTVILNLL